LDAALRRREFAWQVEGFDLAAKRPAKRFVDRLSLGSEREPGVGRPPGERLVVVLVELDGVRPFDDALRGSFGGKLEPDPLAAGRRRVAVARDRPPAGTYGGKA
jgi:hypothetical protein